jgi:hypothetical protein
MGGYATSDSEVDDESSHVTLNSNDASNLKAGIQGQTCYSLGYESRSFSNLRGSQSTLLLMRPSANKIMCEALIFLSWIDMTRFNNHTSGQAKYAGRVQAQRSAIRLVELGPRMKLHLVKVQSDLFTGDVLYHSFLHKTKKEVAEIKKKKEDKTLLKKRSFSIS